MNLNGTYSSAPTNLEPFCNFLSSEFFAPAIQLTTDCFLYFTSPFIHGQMFIFHGATGTKHAFADRYEAQTYM